MAPATADRRCVLLGVTGGIAACKAPLLVRRLRERGLDVRVAPTQNACRFVAPLTLEVLAGNELYGAGYLSPGVDGEEQHIEAAQWADALCVAPTTANTLVRLAYGLADDFLTTTALAVEGPWIIAPAMHPAMWSKPQIVEAVERLRAQGAVIVGPEQGALASGEEGLGRMSEPETIAEATWSALGPSDLAGRAVLITAGPTHEAVDPVRYLGNRSSGKMGYALAAEAARRGADVTLISGPVALSSPWRVNRVPVESAGQMAEQVRSRAAGADIVVMAAAVADYRPAKRCDRKLKKRDGSLDSIDLVENEDILAGLRDWAHDAFLVGFAAETDDLLENATAKLEAKRADLLVANDVSRGDIGFGADDNEIVMLAPGEEPRRVGRAPKSVIAERIFDRVLEQLGRRSAPGGPEVDSECADVASEGADG